MGIVDILSTVYKVNRVCEKMLALQNCSHFMCLVAAKNSQL